MIEYILDHRDNKYKLIEINPRMWGSIMLSEFCNSNMLDNYINISVGGKTKKKILFVKDILDGFSLMSLYIVS